MNVGETALNGITHSKPDEAAADRCHRETLHGDKMREGGAAFAEK
jgi:hypothetical protein